MAHLVLRDTCARSPRKQACSFLKKRTKKLSNESASHSLAEREAPSRKSLFASFSSEKEEPYAG
jgi:hypothetical protein